MRLGTYLHELWRTRFGLPVALVVAALAALLSAYRVSVVSPAVHARAVAMAAASTHVLVDNPSSILLNPQDPGAVDQMTQRATLLGNIVSSEPVRLYIAQRLRIPAQAIKVQPPTTPQYPMPFQDPNNKRRTTDLLKSNNEYRIDVEANPTVPILGIYTEARTKALAVALANAAVQGLNDYVTNVAQNQGVKAAAQVRLLQLGAAEGGTVTPGAATQLMAIVFLLTFAFACTISVVLARLVRGWRTARDAHRRDGGDQRSPLAHRNGEARPTLAT